MSRRKRKIRNIKNKQNYKNLSRGKDRKCDLKNSETFFGSFGEFRQIFFFLQFSENLKKDLKYWKIRDIFTEIGKILGKLEK